MAIIIYTRIKEQLESEWRVIKIQRTQNHTNLIANKSSKVRKRERNISLGD